MTFAWSLFLVAGNKLTGVIFIRQSFVNGANNWYRTANYTHCSFIGLFFVWLFVFVFLCWNTVSCTSFYIKPFCSVVIVLLYHCWNFFPFPTCFDCSWMNAALSFPSRQLHLTFQITIISYRWLDSYSLIALFSPPTAIHVGVFFFSFGVSWSWQ